MTIYFKDGSSREVYKITFAGKIAELYLVDGSVITVPAEKLDLPSSGIAAPVGTYGTSRVNGERTVPRGKVGALIDPKRQAKLKEDWDSSEKTAVAIRSIGMIQKGDTVKIAGETTANSRPTILDYYDETEYDYDPQSHRYIFAQKNFDHAYVVIYKNQDGSFGKRLFDAASFQDYFKLNEVKATPKPLPEYPVIPDHVEGDHSTAEPPANDTDTLEVKPEASPQTGTSTAEEPPTTASPAPSTRENTASVETQTQEQGGRRRNLIAFSVFVAVVIAMGIGAWFVIQRMQRSYIDTSKFKRYEEDLREFEIAIWLRNGKTVDQLMEICLKKFYQDSPAVLSICSKMLKGNQKALLIPFISSQTHKSSTEAAIIFDQIHAQMETIRNLIQEVSHKTGIPPAKPAVEVTQKSVATELPRVVTAPTKAAVPVPPPLPKAAPQVPAVMESHVPGHATSSVSFQADKRVSGKLIEPDAPMRTGSDLPAYANSVLSQISFLSSKEEK
jgi:hypothetical protein